MKRRGPILIGTSKGTSHWWVCCCGGYTMLHLASRLANVVRQAVRQLDEISSFYDFLEIQYPAIWRCFLVLNTSFENENEMQMKWKITIKINVEKWAVLRCTHSLSPKQHGYTLLGHDIAIKKLYTYLGVGINNTMTWSSHTQTISNKSTIKC